MKKGFVIPEWMIAIDRHTAALREGTYLGNEVTDLEITDDRARCTLWPGMLQVWIRGEL